MGKWVRWLWLRDTLFCYGYGTMRVSINHQTDAVPVELRTRESVFVVSSVRGLHSYGDLTKLERYHDRRPWFYGGINNFGLGCSSMMLSSVCVRPNWFHHHYLFES
ncbi:unnamed protein product [Brassica napus]|uniref:(rape) hypothetical protein n=1 Tax=Brassica napus TaxID=3708 RepID=A0A816RGS4_BRANA|nr:unnamed protein product [Brassica napus]